MTLARVTRTAVWPRGAYCARRRELLWKEAVFTLKASRPGFWLTSIWFYLLPLWPRIPVESVGFWLGLLYVGFPLGMAIYASNDVTDTATDRLNPRKDSFLFGARPTAKQIKVLPLRIMGAQLPFIAILTWWIGPKAIALFGGILAMTAWYNLPRYGAKDRPGLDVLAQVGYLGVFVLSSWASGRALAPWQVFVFGALFAMHSHLFGEIMDREPDAAAGRRTTAVAIGTRATKWIMVFMMTAEAWLAVSITEKPWLPVILAGGAVVFLWDACAGWRGGSYAAWQMKAFFLGWNLFLAGEIGLSVALACGWIHGRFL